VQVLGSAHIPSVTCCLKQAEFEPVFQGLKKTCVWPSGLSWGVTDDEQNCHVLRFKSQGWA